MPQLALYLGVSYLHVGDPALAEQTLSAARRSAPPDLIEEVDWYLALARVRAGNVATARDDLERLCRRSGDFAPQACAGLIELGR